MALLAPLDLQPIAVVDLSGNPEVFSFVAILLISYVFAKFDFSNRIALTLFALFAIVMASYLQALYVLVILIIGIFVYNTLARLMK